MNSQVSANWRDVGPLEAIPARGARVVRLEGTCIAVFRTADDRVYALHDACPHKAGPLSQGIVHDVSVTCPLHNWVIRLETGEVAGPDRGRARTVPARLSNGRIELALDSVALPA